MRLGGSVTYPNIPVLRFKIALGRNAGGPRRDWSAVKPEVLLLRAEGRSFGEISRVLDVPKTTVIRLYYQA